MKTTTRILVIAAVLGLPQILSRAKAEQPPSKAKSAMVADDADVIVNKADTTAFLGYYVGSFFDHKITVRLEKVIGDTVTGYSVVAGNERAFSGSFEIGPPGTLGELTAKVVAKEPGDSATDGIFSFNVSKDGTLVGVWTPYNKKSKPAALSLFRREFKYDPMVGEHPESSMRLLKTKDVANLLPEELRLMRNEMYARHGYSFKLRDMQEHFDKQEWYMPLSTDVTETLTKIELANQALIKRYENYSADHYDSFGR